MSAHTLPSQLNSAPFEVLDPGSGHHLVVSRWNQHVVIKIGSGSETNTLPNPTGPGQKLNLIAGVDGGGSRVVTAVAAINQAGNTTMTFGDQYDAISLESYSMGDGTFRWRVVYNDGVTLG